MRSAQQYQQHPQHAGAQQYGLQHSGAHPSFHEHFMQTDTNN